MICFTKCKNSSTTVGQTMERGGGEVQKCRSWVAAQYSIRYRQSHCRFEIDFWYRTNY